MSALRRRRGAFDIWPGFVDALTSLIMVMIFVLLIFAIGQFVLSDTLSGKNRTLDALNARVAELAHTLSLTEAQKATLDARVAELAASLDHTAGERDAASAQAAALGTDVAALSALKQQLEAEVARMAAELDTTHAAVVQQTDLSQSQAAQVTLLNRQLAALNEQLARIQQALDIAGTEAAAKDARIADLGRQLNVALANKVGELERYRSEFFGRLRAALGERSDLRIVGDRFVLPTDILFPTGSAELDPTAQQSLATLAASVREIAAEIPSSIDWVLRIDGHTDRRPIHTAQFPSNWELSSARALAIVKYLVVQGIPANRLSANGFGEFQPLDTAATPEAWAKNRRIEIQLTNR